MSQATGEIVVDFIRVAENYVPDGGIPPLVDRAALFGRDGVPWYWEREGDWIDRGRPDQLTLTMTFEGGAA